MSAGTHPYKQRANLHTLILVMSFLSALRRSPLLLTPLLLSPALIGGFCSVASAQIQVGTNQGINFGQALINSACTVTTSDGSIGVRANRNLITSDTLEGGNFTGTLAAATVTAVSNLSSTSFVKVDNPTLTGTTAATTAQVKFGSGAWGSSGQVNLGTDGTLAATPLHVKFSTTNNGTRFANGTYTASATVSCYDGL